MSMRRSTRSRTRDSGTPSSARVWGTGGLKALRTGAKVAMATYVSAVGRVEITFRMRGEGVAPALTGAAGVGASYWADSRRLIESDRDVRWRGTNSKQLLARRPEQAWAGW